MGARELIVLPVCRVSLSPRPERRNHRAGSALSAVAVAVLEAEGAQDPLSGGEGGHLQGDALPQLLGLLASLQVLQHIVELHHAHRCQAERTTSAADDVHKVIVVCRRQVDEPVVDVLQREAGTGSHWF